MPQEIEPIVTPLGLVTQPNKLGVYPPGALLQAVGCVIRSPGLLSTAPKLTSFVTSPFIGVEPVTPHLFGASDSQYFHVARRNSDSHWEIAFNDGVNKYGNDLFNSTPDIPYEPITFDTTGKINVTRNRDRLLFNSLDGVLIVDTAQPTSNATAKPRMAGFVQPTVTANANTAPPVGAIAADSHCSITAILRRKFADGYEAISAPAAAAQLLNNGGPAVTSNITVNIEWKNISGVVAGDIIEVYRTRQAATSGGVSGAVAVGASFFRSVVYVITAADIIADFAAILDRTPDSNLGEELYTNPGADGDTGAKLPPPLAATMATFRGHTLYANTTDVASITLAVAGGIYPMGNGAAISAYNRTIGIGQRIFSATFAIGSPTLTVISAAEIVGLAVGQIVFDAGLVGGQGTITAVGAASVTLNANANAAGIRITLSRDVIEIDGTSYSGDSWGTLGSGAIPFLSRLGQIDIAVHASTLVGVAAGIVFTTPQEFTIQRAYAGGGSFTIRASNGGNYDPRLPTMSETARTVSPEVKPNLVEWSEQGQPEAVCSVNRQPVGSGTIYAMLPTRDAVWMFSSDGLWRWTGRGGSARDGYDWSCDPVDSTLSLSAPQAACVLRDTVYALTNRGLVAISDAGIDDTLSVGVIDDILTSPPFSATTAFHVVANETDDEIWVGRISGGLQTYFIYNTVTKAWTTHLGGNSGAQTDLIHTYARFAQGMASIDTGDIWTQSASQFGPATVDYQPISSRAPFSMKQWQDMVVVCAASDAGKTITPRFNGTNFTSRDLISQNRDARVGFGVPRNAPAVANTLSPGLTIASSLEARLYGVVLRSVELTDQRKNR